MTGIIGMIGIIAGNGALPVLLASKLKAEGNSAVIAAHLYEADEILETLSKDHIWIQVGALKKIITFFKKNKVTEIVFVGGIKKSRLFKTFRPDFLTVKALINAKTNNDDSVLRNVLSVFEKEGFIVKSIQDFLPELLPQKGVLTSRGLTTDEKENMEIGIPVAKAIGSLDVGQAVFVSKKSVVAVEAIEGTDEMLKRVISLGVKGGVLVKFSKGNQDTRVDLPTIGVQTILRLSEIGASAVVIEAQKTIILEPQEVITAAEKFGIAIEAV